MYQKLLLIPQNPCKHHLYALIFHFCFQDAIQFEEMLLLKKGAILCLRTCRHAFINCTYMARFNYACMCFQERWQHSNFTTKSEIVFNAITNGFNFLLHFLFIGTDPKKTNEQNEKLKFKVLDYFGQILQSNLKCFLLKCCI